MSDAAPLLVELLCEELPPKALARLGDAFAAGLLDALREQQLAVDDARGVPFATPRRLAVLIDPVRARAPDQTVRVKGPSVSVGLDANGEPTVALRKWADKQGASLEQLSRESDGRQDSFWFTRTQAGAALDSAIEAAIARALERLPIPKVMHYQLGDGTTTVSFVRPAHGLLVLHGTAVLPASVLGLRSSRLTHGHRFLGRAEIELEHANDYERRLTDEGRVIPSFARRRSRIESMLRDAAAGLRASLGDDAEVSELLDEVTALVEWPAVYVGEFEREFLSVPQECLILTMRTNQKYFPLFDAQGRLEPRFLIVSNMQIADASNIVDGNERVVRPRLADARFFFEQDRRRRLAERVPQLAQVVYHAKLGTLAQRVDRIRALAGAIATRLGTDAAAAEHAATLAKADLLTAMVGEFPELQGVMGRHYALHDGEPAEVCEAIAEHYRPRYSGDALPRTDAGTAVALADKLE
ncbi:MAG TPA: glycine--tRNA ligase subunit beta, partial [Burkholderiaceae bacterium]|nr:glycine--tRNA ligase subunit beta [Burkholderiaceae bacterium]